MRIAFVTTSFPRRRNDHYSRFVFEQAKSLVDQGDAEVVIVAPHGPGQSCRECTSNLHVQRFRYAPEQWERLAYRHEGLFQTLKENPWSALLLPAFLISMGAKLYRESKGASVIHAQWLPTTAVAIPISWLRGIPLIVSVRGADINTARGSLMAKRLSRFLLNRCDQVLTVSREFQDYLRRDIGVQRPVDALFNGVDIDQFKPRDSTSARQKLSLPGNRPIVLYIGGLIRRKSISTLLHALHQLPSGKRPLTLLGGEGPLREELIQLQYSLGLTDDEVRFLGPIKRESITTWYNAADLFVLPSLSEGRPNVVLEAMASGLPTIATSVNGSVELIRHGESGWLFEPGDHEQLAVLIQHALINRSATGKIGRQGRQMIISQGLTWEAHGDTLLRFYGRAIDCRSTPLPEK